MKIRYKALVHEVIGDAPFIGALISAIDCKYGCAKCFNQHLKKDKIYFEAEASEIVRQIKANPLNKGIIFGGLEWSLQGVEMLELAKVAHEEGLEIMIYTGAPSPREFHRIIGECVLKAGDGKFEYVTHADLDNHDFQTMVGDVMCNIYMENRYYLKFGKYIFTKEVDDNIQHGVKLASSNQFIIKFFED